MCSRRYFLGISLSLLALCAPTGWLASKEPLEPAIRAEDRNHWAFRIPMRPELPSGHNGNWIRTPVDTFIVARLEKAGLRPAATADRATLLRRITQGIIGLPPTPADLQHFLQDQRPDAYERVVERLLASAHYGERWAQHWLDVVRYAESNGYEGDNERPHAWRYRDYVIQALNHDKPFDRFLTEQL